LKAKTQHVHTVNASGQSIGITDQYLDTLNDLLKTAYPIGAYAMGVVSALAWRQKMQPDRRLLYNASVCIAVRAVPIIFDAWASEKLTKGAK